MSENIFLLGVGCQKGGTTWVRNQLVKHPHINMGFTKEYHIFDALFLEESRYFLKNRKQELINHLKISESTNCRTQTYLFKLLDFYQNIDCYFDYFEYLTLRSDNTRIVGDFTPSYCGLPIETFKLIKKKTQERGFILKVIFLMRDPIERLWSQIRMERELWKKKNKNPLLELNEQEEVLQNFSSRSAQLRTRYENTIVNLESVFDLEDIFYGFYEKLFNDTTMENLAKFLGIEDLEVDYELILNASPKTITNLDDSIKHTIADYYRETYNFCSNRFDTHRIWKGYNYL